MRAGCRATAIIVISSISAMLSLHAQSNPVVSVTGGQIEGRGLPAGGAVFKGVPFARPPVGDYRWREPGAVVPWQGVRDAGEYGPACMQQGNANANNQKAAYKEDCLYLNIWTPEWPATSPKAVMVRLYGGGNVMGAGSSPQFDGVSLTRKGVILVTINYRMGLFGFFAHPGLTAESPHHASGTLFGQSSGAGSASYLIASPLAKGLFQRAICESSGGMAVGRHVSLDLATSEKAGLEFAAQAGAHSLAELRAMPAADLLKLKWGIREIIDGWAETDRLDNIFAAGKQNDVPILAGSNSDEGANVVTHPLSAEKWVEQVKHDYGSQADGYLKLYPGDSDKQAEQSQRNEARDLRAWNARTLVRMEDHAGKSKGYLYFFSRNPTGVLDPTSDFPTLSKPGAAHASEIVYVYNHLEAQGRPWQPWDHALADTMSSYWVNFAKTGDPNGPGLLIWPAYNPKTDELMHFGDKISVEPEPLKRVIDAVDPFYSVSSAK